MSNWCPTYHNPLLPGWRRILPLCFFFLLEETPPRKYYVCLCLSSFARLGFPKSLLGVRYCVCICICHEGHLPPSSLIGENITFCHTLTSPGKIPHVRVAPVSDESKIFQNSDCEPLSIPYSMPFL